MTPNRKLLIVIMDGVGVRKEAFGNAFLAAKTPHLNKLQHDAMYRTIYAHGTYVGLPSDSDIGNSEVGHNALGSGQIYDQGAKLVQMAIDDQSLFQGKCWRALCDQVTAKKSTLHFIGLLSDGNVHSHELHLHAMLRQAKKSGVKRVRIHALLDGRDVSEKSAELYVERLEAVMTELRDGGFDVLVASGGGRMQVTMDRYEADWTMVERGWQAHVLGQAEFEFDDLPSAVRYFRNNTKLSDQNIPAFAMTKNGQPVGRINDGDGVVFFNFRGDRAIEICRAFTDKNFDKFKRESRPEVFFAGMMQYDGDLRIPEFYLVSPPQIKNTMSEYLTGLGVRQFACSETQKYGHVTYFWNGNRFNKFDDQLETYVEVPSDNISFDQKPEMKAQEITDQTISHLASEKFQMGRINFANGDMVGHTGNFLAAVASMETVDHCMGQLRSACEQHDVILVVTADHGNCDEMFEGKESEFPDWRENPDKVRPKTAHTLNPVPLYIFDPRGMDHYSWRDVKVAGLANIANTVLVLIGLEPRAIYQESLIDKHD